jgi:hypothetical protein
MVSGIRVIGGSRLEIPNTICHQTGHCSRDQSNQMPDTTSFIFWYPICTDSPKATVMTINMPLNALALLTIFVLLLSSCAPAQNNYVYKPGSQPLYDTIARMDSVYFTAYNNCDMVTQAAIYSDSLEFYHDRSGLATSKQVILAAIKNNICGKVTRVLVNGSLEVYPPERFVVVWRNKDGKWQITRVISLHGGS